MFVHVDHFSFFKNKLKFTLKCDIFTFVLYPYIALLNLFFVWQYDPVIFHSTFARVFGRPNIHLKVRFAWNLLIQLYDPLLLQSFAFDLCFDF